MVRHCDSISQSIGQKSLTTETLNNYYLSIRPGVIDNGSSMCKVGFAGDDQPRASFPSIVGRPKYPTHMPRGLQIGQSAQRGGIFTLRKPMRNGIVQDFDDMSEIWKHCFLNELRTCPEQQPYLLTESICFSNSCTKRNNQKITEVMFETFKVPAFYLAMQAVLSLYPSGSIIGLVLDSGDAITQSLPIYDGYAIRHAISWNNLAGNGLTEYFKNLQTYGDFKTCIIRQIKEKLCYVKNEQDNFRPQTLYELPDGSIIRLDAQLLSECPEALFNPILAGKQHPGIHQITHASIMICDVETRKQLFKNIVQSGGSTMFRGFRERFTRQITNEAPNTTGIKVLVPPERNFSTIIGGMILASLSTFQDMWISEADYKQCGPQIVHRKCFEL